MSSDETTNRISELQMMISEVLGGLSADVIEQRREITACKAQLETLATQIFEIHEALIVLSDRLKRLKT